MSPAQIRISAARVRISAARVRISRYFHRREESGAVFVVVALSMVMILGAVSMSFDIGKQIDRSRNMQAVSDAVALDTAQYLPGDTASQYAALGSAPWAQLQAESVTSAGRNGFVIAGNGGPSTNFMTLTAGIFDPAATPNFIPVVSTDPSIGDQVTSGDPIVNAVQVTTSSNQTFGFVSGNQQVAKTATAMRAIPDSACSGCAPAKVTSAISGFTIGSYLADVNTQTSVLNALLGPLGTNLSLSALGYQGLASTDITLADLVGADVGLGTVNGFLGAKFPPGTLLSGVGSAITQKIAGLTASGQPIPTGLVQAQRDINTIAAGITSGTPLTVCQLFNSGSMGPNCTYQPGSVGNMNLLSLVTGIIELADGQSAINLGGGIPGVLSLGISAIQPPQIALPGPINVTKAKTSQATVTLGLGLPLLLTANVKVVASGAQGTLTGITCTTPVANSTTKIHVDTRGATATLSVGLQVPLLGNVPVLSDTGSVATTHQDLIFHGPFNDSNLQSTSDASLGISWDNPQVLSGLIPLPAGSIINLVGSALLPVLGPVLDALGVNLAGADVVNNYLNCGLPILVKTK